MYSLLCSHSVMEERVGLSRLLVPTFTLSMLLGPPSCHSVKILSLYHHWKLWRKPLQCKFHMMHRLLYLLSSIECILVTITAYQPHFTSPVHLSLFHSVDTGRQVEYDVQEIAVEMDREEEDEEDWLKMDQPPEWLRRVEIDEYDAWLPPPVRPAPPPEVCMCWLQWKMSLLSYAYSAVSVNARRCMLYICMYNGWGVLSLLTLCPI